MKLIFTGGGSGGHTMPAIAMIEDIREYCKNSGIDLSVDYIGSKSGIERSVCERKSIVYHPISTGKLRRYFSIQNSIDIFKVVLGYFQSRKLLRRIKPDLLISTGGFVSVPPVVAAGRMKIKVLVHEQTIEIGLANRIAGRYAARIAVSFPESVKFYPDNKTKITGLPLRKSLFTGDRINALKKFGFAIDLPVIYFTGGGLGCHILNLATLEILEQLLKDAQVIYQSGRPQGTDDFEQLQNRISHLPDELQSRIRLYDFISDDISDVMACIDLAVGRAGAGTVNEFLALAIPAVYIPLAIAMRNEQFKNAMVAVQAGGAVIIEEKELTAVKLLKIVVSLIDGNRLSGMKTCLKEYSYRNGTIAMREEILMLTDEKRTKE